MRGSYYPFIGPIRPRPYKVTFFAKFWRLELEMEFLVFVPIYYLEILLLQKNGSAVAVIFHVLSVLFVKVITKQLSLCYNASITKLRL